MNTAACLEALNHSFQANVGIFLPQTIVNMPDKVLHSASKMTLWSFVSGQVFFDGRG